VQYASRAGPHPGRTQIARWTRAALERDARVTIRIVDGGEARALNRRFRGRDRATNVLAFVMREEPRLEGDIVLCAPVIAREARAGGRSAAAHYAHLVVHGVLHLQGYDHERASDARAMERRETRIVTGLGFSDPYAPQAGERAMRTEKGARRRAGRCAASSSLVPRPPSR
jgi:probable rRNA maturation factor